MSKLKGPLSSLNASGRLTAGLTFLRRRFTNIVERTPQPKDAKSFAQLSWRHMYQKAVALWWGLSVAEKQSWESLARPFHMTGFAYFISQALKPNPGLYLPLQGGIMAGDIDMDGNKIEALPDPTANQDAATKAYVDALLNFLSLSDTPASYAGQALKVVRVNAGTNALEFAALAALSSKFNWETRNMQAASGDVSYVGYGFQPTCLTLFSCFEGKDIACWGIMDSAGAEEGIFILEDTAVFHRTSALIQLEESAGKGQYGFFKSYDADGFSLSWVKGGAPSAGTANLEVLALR